MVPLDGVEAWLVGATVSPSPAMASGSLLKALFLLSTRSIAPPSTGDFVAEGGLDGAVPPAAANLLGGCCGSLGESESLVRFFFRRLPRDGMSAVLAEVWRFQVVREPSAAGVSGDCEALEWHLSGDNLPCLSLIFARSVSGCRICDARNAAETVRLEIVPIVVQANALK